MTQGHPLRAAAWMLGAIFCFTAMAVAGRTLGSSHDTFEIMAYRSLLGIVIVLGFGMALGTLGQVTRRNIGLHTLRNLAHFAGQNLWFYAITLIPLAQVFALEFTSPIWVALLAPLVLREKLTRLRAITALIGFLGVLFVAQPFSGMALNTGVLAAAGAALGFAGSAIFTRALTRTETITCILFYLTVMQAVFGLICAGYDGDIALPTADTAPLLALVGCAGLMAHFCMTKALAMAPASVVMPVDFARLPIIAVVGFVLYGEGLTWGIAIGGTIILVANWINIQAETRQQGSVAQNHHLSP